MGVRWGGKIYRWRDDVCCMNAIYLLILLITLLAPTNNDMKNAFMALAKSSVNASTVTARRIGPVSQPI